MRVPDTLARAFDTAFDAAFEKRLSLFATERGLLEEAGDLNSRRFLARSVAPHVKKLSDQFNRAQDIGLDPYWRKTSNLNNLRLAYFLSFMPPNLFRAASVWAELVRLGFKWSAPGDELRAIELGSGPASGACGIAAGEKFCATGLPMKGSWAMLEQNKAILELGCAWAETFFGCDEFSPARLSWALRPFHRKIDFSVKNWLPRSAPKFNLWLMSFFINESDENPEIIANSLMHTWERHLDENGIVIMIEPALKQQSRKLLALRKHIIEAASRGGKGVDPGWLQVLLPCLGHQRCGALEAPDDWCHEEVSWWRPPYLRVIDQMTGLDRKSLPFSYLVLIRSNKPREEILTGLAGGGHSATSRHRLVSPAHKEGHALEFYVCGKDGKKKRRIKRGTVLDGIPALNQSPERGDIIY